MSLRKNFIYNTIYQIFIILLPIITVPYVSRVLGPAGVGDYSYTLSYAQYFVLFGMIGISLYGSRHIAYVKHDEERLSEEFWSIYTLQFITTLISLVIYIIIFVLINNQNKNLYLVQGIVVLTAIFDISWFFMGYEDMKSIVIRNSIAKVCGVLCVFLFVKKPTDVILYAIIMATSSFVGQVVMWLNLFNKIKLRSININIKKVIVHIRPSMSLFISQIAIQIYTLLDKTMLGIMTDVSQVGLYENSQKTIKLALTLVTSLGAVMLPRMSSLYSQGEIDKLKEMIYKAFSYVNFMAFPMVLGLVAISNSFSLWFYGEAFNGIEILLKVGSILMIAIGWGNILGIQILLPMKKENQFTIAVICGAVVNFILNLIIIKSFQAIGTTISSVIAEFTVTGVELYLLRDFISIKRIVKISIKPLIASTIMFFVVVLLGCFLKVGIVWTAIEVSIGGIIYLIIMYILKDNFLIEILNTFSNRLKK